MYQIPDYNKYSGYFTHPKAFSETIYLTKNISYQQVPSRSFPAKNVL